MSIYARLGVRPVINAMGSVTIYGGSLMPAPVLEAMVEAAGCYVPLRTLQERAGARIAELAGVEAALISSGAAGGITLAVAGCLTGLDPDKVQALPDTSRFERNEVIVVSGRRPNYMYQAAEAVGARLVHVGSAARVTPDDIAAAIGPRTAGVLLIVATLDQQRARAPEVTLTIENAAAVTRAAGVPLLVDAAAELPPAENLRAFLRQGADVAIFSGGKGLRGPQASGLVLGRSDLIAAAAANNNPNSAIGRPLKVGKEEIAGLVRAVELFVERDEAAERRGWEAIVHHVAAALAGRPGVRTEVVVDGRYARPSVLPVCLIHLDAAAPAEVARRLLEGEPAVAVGSFDGGVLVNPIAMVAGEEQVVADRLRQVLG
jgi:D-glucosaminate-6-phosphate ammonia-lyase